MNSVTVHTDLLAFIIIFPLIGSLVTFSVSCFSDENKSLFNIAPWIAFICSSFSFVFSVLSFKKLNIAHDFELKQHLWHWFSVGEVDVNMSLMLDKLSSVMILVITGVGTLIHLYSTGYMAHDKSKPRFFSYLNLFLVAMLLLVLGDNLLVLFLSLIHI